ncbi:TadE/TadG family type IV pilus assembly protein [Phenylobacterium sp.]|uniref:TadE/TadG family type IV pilus assembly protein n=1 Tax=Phenylobacterium sp. TaxID=1871053 RepID=UPI0035AEB1FC
MPFARFAQDRRGAAAVEMALLAPILLLILGGLFDTSRLVFQTMQVNATAQAGVDFALNHPWDAAAVRAAAESATDLPETVALPERRIRCVAGGKIVDCADPAGGAPYVTVTATLPFVPITPGAGLAMPEALTATATARTP